jgi:hypothetical protein
MALLRVPQSALSINIYMAVEATVCTPHTSEKQQQITCRCSYQGSRWDGLRHASPTGSLIRQETGEGHATNESPDPHTPVNKRRGIACRLHET